MYQAVFFDAFNTLFGTRWAKDTATKRLPLQRTVKHFLHNLDASLQATYGRARTGEAGIPARIFAAFADWSGMAKTGPLALLRRNETAVLSWFRVYSDALYTLQVLSETCKLGIISNAWPYLESLLHFLGLWPYFESVVISAKVGISKPNPAIYELALRLFHIPAEQAIFVDDIPKNVLAAEHVGLKGLWLVRTPLPMDNVPAAYRHLTQIYSLQEVIPFVMGA
nr:HAD family hydrolase [Chloroflexota bacterium]